MRRTLPIAFAVAFAFAFAVAALAPAGASAAACAGPTAGLSFATAPQSGSLATAGEVDCYALDDVAAGDVVEVRLTVTMAWRIVDGNGTVVCENWSGAACQLWGVGGWSLELYDPWGQATPLPYTFTARRLTDPEGCDPLDDADVWSFTAPRIDGSLDGGLDARCYTFSRAVREADGAYWFRTVRTSGTLSPRWRVFGPSGGVECAESSDLYVRCSLLAAGSYTLVVEADGSSGAGTYYLTANRTTSPVGCESLPAPSFDAAPVAGAIGTVGEIDCFALSDVAAGDVVEVRTSGSGWWTLVDGNGEALCGGWSAGTCRLTGNGGWSILVYDPAGTQTFSYALTARRLTAPEGCEPLGEPEVWSFAASRIDGSIPGALTARCYTFSRAAGEPDGAYWFRTARTAGTINPRYRIFGPTGELECSSSNAASYQRCELLAAGEFIVVVDNGESTSTGAFYLLPKRTTTPAGCVALGPIAFGDPSLSAGIGVAGEIDCYALGEVGGDDLLEVRVTDGMQWTVVDAGGVAQCSGFAEGVCPLSGAPGWTLLVHDPTPTRTSSYRLVVRRMTDAAGCAPLDVPAAWAFTTPRIDGTIEGALDAECFTFSRALGEEDGSYWFRTARTTGTLGPRWRVFGPTGAQECAGSTSFWYDRCQLLGAGEYVLVVDDGNAGSTGTFFLTAKRTTTPAGCAVLPSIALGLPTTQGKLARGGEIDCYALPASTDDRLSFRLTGAADLLALVDATGTSRCLASGDNVCTVAGDSPYYVLVHASSTTTTGGYTLAATCENVPCGQSETAVTDVVPNRVGQGERTTLLLRGRDLALLEHVALIRGEQSIEGDLQPAAPEGRGIEARFDLAHAPTGSWRLEATFIDGTERTLADAVTVETERPASVDVELVGRDAFRVGQPGAVTIEVTNTGNVDAIGVPVVLAGIPADATVVPSFEVAAPVGGSDPTGYENVPFDQGHHATTVGDTLAVPMLIARLPAGRSVRMEYRITVPRAHDLSLRAVGGDCLATTFPGPALFSAARPADHDVPGDARVNCAGELANFELRRELAGFVPGSECIEFVGERFSDGMVNAAGGEKETFFSIDGVLSWTLGGANCLAGAFPPTKLLRVSKKTSDLIAVGLTVADAGVDVTEGVGDCLRAADGSHLEQRAVFAIDPNDIVGPAGAGAQRYIPGDVPSAYQVLFENLPSATAPAQRVEIVDQLDVAIFDPAGVLFEDVRFGETVYRLPYPAHEIDHTIDLRPEQDMLVQVSAEVGSEGQIRWILQAIDPETLAPPEDPLAGFLPPNDVSPEGEGLVSYRVELRDLPSGAVVPNRASIRFDANEPIETPTWTNTIDRQPPTATIAAQAGADAAAATVRWSGADDAAGVETWELWVGRDGGPLALWRVADAPGAATFTAPASGTYRFRAVAHDGAGNVGQSTQASIELRVESNQGRQGAGSVTPPPPPPPPPTTVALPTLLIRDAPSPRASRRGLVVLPVTIGCAGAGPDCTVRGTARVTGLGPRAIGRIDQTVDAGTSARTRLVLTRRGLRLLLRRRTVAVAIVLRVSRQTAIVEERLRLKLRAPARPGGRRTR